MTTDRFRYGVVIDQRLPRGDLGVPAFFDGWYNTRALANKAASIFLSKAPGAVVYVVLLGDETDMLARK